MKNRCPGADSISFLSRLARDRRGNVAAIAGISLIPIGVVVGSSIDVSRYYLTKNRLQHACDASVLATRKAMQGFDLTTEAKAQGQAFFKVNFPKGTFGTSAEAISITANDDGTVNGLAVVTTSASLLGNFGMEAKQLSANCSAKMDLPNTDIVFALDTTGSMRETNSGDSKTRIEALRDAVRGFTGTLDDIAAGGVQVRYGFVPFSSTVNVGRLLRREWMVDRWTYQSRVADGVRTITDTWNSGDKTNYGSWQFISGSYSESRSVGTAERVDVPGKPGKPKVCSGGSGGELGGGPKCTGPTAPQPGYSYWRCRNVPSDTDSTNKVSTPWVVSGNTKTRTTTETKNGIEYDGDVEGSTCYIKKKTWSNYKRSRTETVTPGTEQSSNRYEYDWIYKPVEYNVAPLKGRGPLMNGVSITATKLGNYHTDVTIPWDGCIEERDTIRNRTFPTIPTAAYDLDIDRVPDSDATRWRPFLPQLVYWRKNHQNWDTSDWRTTENSTRADEFASGDAAVCPTASRKLAVMTSQEVSEYVDSLEPKGTTYLDIGMIWAARLVSPTGLWKSENQTASNGGPISRHIIFMTDGQIETKNMVYEAYGLSALDRRRSNQGQVPNDADANENVDARFRAVCAAIKAKGVTVWTIAFGTALTDSLKECATDERFYRANNAAELNAAFTSIATNIARLRLTK